LRSQADLASIKIPVTYIFPKFMSGMTGSRLSNFGKRRGTSVADLTFATYVRTGTLDIETINPTCVE